MNINFDWVAFDISEKDSLKKYCDTEKAIEFCWWLSIDLIGDNGSYSDIENFLSLAKKGVINEWRGNSHWLSFSPTSVVLLKPRGSESYEFTIDEFESGMNNWKIAVKNVDK